MKRVVAFPPRLLLALVFFFGSLAFPAYAKSVVATFGDSLTQNKSWTQDLRDAYTVIDLGQGGERATQGVVRLGQWLAANPSTAHFVVLMEGTNDVFAAPYDPNAPLTALLQMANMVLAASAIPILMAPPPIIQAGQELQDARIHALGQSLAVMLPDGGRFVDLYAAFRAQPDLALLYLSDGLHPSQAGSDVIEAALRPELYNCPGGADPTDTNSDGIGDACQCGDVDGDGWVTLADAVEIRRSLLNPPTATLARPDLCDVGGNAACTLTDALIVRRALLDPPTAKIQPVCAPARP